LELQLCVRFGKFGSSLRDLLIEFLSDTLLLTPEPRLLQPDGSLTRSYAQKQALGLLREIRSLSRRDDYAEFAL
jgi:hypothetical protein